MTRAHTVNECQEMLLDHLRGLVDYIELKSRCETEREKLDLLVFSILSTINGSSVSFPNFKLIPSPHPEDKLYSENCGINYWPDDIDLSDGLHNRWARGKRRSPSGRLL